MRSSLIDKWGFIYVVVKFLSTIKRFFSCFFFQTRKLIEIYYCKTVSNLSHLSTEVIFFVHCYSCCTFVKQSLKTTSTVTFNSLRPLNNFNGIGCTDLSICVLIVFELLISFRLEMRILTIQFPRGVKNVCSTKFGTAFLKLCPFL